MKTDGITKEVLYDLYITKNYNLKQVAEQFNVNGTTISRLLNKYEIVKPKELIVKLRQETNLKKYGTASPMQNSEIRKKANETNLKKYGTASPMQNKEVQEKAKQTTIKHFGVDYPMQNKKILEKANETNLEKYGGTRPIHSEQVKQKMYNTNIERYGVKYITQNDDIKNKVKETNLKRYGVENQFESEDIKNKIKETIKRKYNVDYFCLAKKCRDASKSIDSKPNLTFKSLLENNNIAYEREYSIERCSYDFKVHNLLIEINPTATHNVTHKYRDHDILSKEYHYDKTLLAKGNSSLLSTINI